MVLGHCIQFGNGEDYYSRNMFFENIIFKVIYSFHMPLFAFVSGYFFAVSYHKKNAKQIFVSKVKGILIPIFCWAVLNFGVSFALKVNQRVDISNKWIYETLKNSIFTHWFLWGILCCSILVICIRELFKDRLIIYVFALIVLTIIPNVEQSFSYIFLIPTFLLGYFVKKRRISEKFITMLFNRKIAIYVICISIWIVLLSLYGYDSYIYTSRISLADAENIFQQIYIDTFRWLIGIFGSITVLLTVYFIPILDTIGIELRKIGENTLGIYIISDYFNYNVLYRLTNGFEFSYFRTFLECFVMLVATYMATRIISKQKILNKLFLGGR